MEKSMFENEFLNSMLNISCLESRINIWDKLISEQSSINDNHPVIAAYDANLLLKHIKHNSILDRIPFKGSDFNVGLFLTLFKSESDSQRIMPSEASKYIHDLSLVGKFNSNHVTTLHKSLSELDSASNASIHDHSLFQSANGVENSGNKKNLSTNLRA